MPSGKFAVVSAFDHSIVTATQDEVRDQLIVTSSLEAMAMSRSHRICGMAYQLALFVIECNGYMYSSFAEYVSAFNANAVDIVFMELFVARTPLRLRNCRSIRSIASFLKRRV